LEQRKKLDKFGYGRWLRYVKNTFETLLESQVIDYERDPEQRRRSVTLDDYGILATDFNLSEKMKNELINSGIQYTEKFLDHRN
jgi:NTE family protein